jgi:N-acetylmuramoyl-L-alanine amidase
LLKFTAVIYQHSDKMNLRVCIFFLLATTAAAAQDKIMQDIIKQYSEKAQKFLDKEKALSAFYSIDKEGIKIYSSLNNKLTGKAEFFIAWGSLRTYSYVFKTGEPGEAFKIYKTGKYDPNAPKLDSTGNVIHELPLPKLKIGNSNGIVDYIAAPERKDLRGLKFAIDPGHVAQNFGDGELEKKHIKFKKDLLGNVVDSVEIAEGMLTYATALLLKQKLEEAGAMVMLTRPEGNSAFNKTFQQWKKEDMKKAIDSLYKTGELKLSQKNYFLSAKAKDRDIFRVIFRDLDLAKRAELINAYQPDYTIIIHYNVDESNAEWTTPSNKNFNMTFVGGAFMKNDLSSPEKRFEFLRLLITDDLEKSIDLSVSVISSFEKTLEVPTINDGDAKYISEGCINTGKKGVYCRNLQLTRYVHSPLVYGETLYQDNIKESQLLNKESDKTKNERVKQVAEAYYQGIFNYLKLHP